MRRAANKHQSRKSNLLSVVVTLTAALWLSPALGQVDSKDTLWLSLAPAPALSGPACELHDAPPPVAKKNRGGGKPGGRPQTAQRFESEHRPIPVRTYYLQGPALSPQAEAYVLHPDGSSNQLKIKYGPQPSITFNAPPKADDRLHGANNFYVIDKQVKNGVLTVQSAKWLSIQHSCGWGHDYRNDDNRKSAHGLTQVPLEIIINGLWDGNFHADAQSGMELNILVNALGQPAKGATVSITTEKQWTHTAVTDKDGIAKVQLIKDYYPSGWAKFHRSEQGSFTVTAEYRKDEAGQYNEQPYQQIQYIATFPWRYTPARADYQSYAFGLGLGTFAMFLTGIGVYSFRERRKKPFKGISLE